MLARRAAASGLFIVALWLVVTSYGGGGAVQATALSATSGIHKIKHVVIIMQENRSFDSYFGTYPGADGIPAGTCVPDPMHGGCVRPFHDRSDVDFGGPHSAWNSRKDINGGLMDGFVKQAEGGSSCSSVD